MTDEMTPESDLPQNALTLDTVSSKSWWQSRGIVGSLMVVAAQLGSLAGLEIDAGMMTEIAMQAITLCGGMLALWGRAKASQPIAPMRQKG